MQRLVSLTALFVIATACRAAPSPRAVEASSESPAAAVANPQPDALKTAIVEAIRSRNEPVAAALVNVADGRAIALAGQHGADPEQSAFRPGSSVKPLTAWFAARHGLLASDERIGCNGRHATQSDLVCFAEHGLLDVTHAIEVSCNVFFYDLGVRLGYPRLRSELAGLGFGRAPGTLADESESESGERAAAVVATGHGPFEATIVQLASAYAELARGLGDSPAERAIAAGMLEVVQGDEGTGRAAAVEGLAIAGKTGTAEAERFGEQPRSNAKENGWFVGYAPASAPRVVVAALVLGGGPGGQSAAPIAGRIFRAWHAQRASSD